jgi:hypothetical protein
MGKF